MFTASENLITSERNPMLSNNKEVGGRNVASLELCKELYELSGWKEDGSFWSLGGGLNWKPCQTTLGLNSQKLKNRITKGLAIPAYDLGYLLRKLPSIPEIKKRAGNTWEAVCRIGEIVDGKVEDKTTWAKSKSPEDAVCKLAIELFKQNLMKGTPNEK